MADLSPELRGVLTEMVSYIRTSQTELEKSASLRSKFHGYRVKIAMVVDNLVSRGIVPLADKMSLYEELVDSPEKAADMLVKLSTEVGPSTLGGPSDLNDLDSRDAIERFAMDHT